MMKKEQRKSLIFTKDPEFKRRITAMLIDAAFPAEKFVVQKTNEGRDKFEADKMVVNVLINGSDYPGKEVFEMVASLDDMFKSRKCFVLVYLSEDQFLAVAPIRKKFETIKFYELPAKMKDLNEVYNPVGVSRKPAPVMVPPTGNQAVKEGERKGNLNFWETSAHVKDTVDSIKALADNKGDLEKLFHIGQRFNGIFGAFSYVAEKPGYKELMSLSHIIDDVARHYQTGDLKQIEQKHFDIIYEAAKCSYLMLKDLRDDKPLNQEHVTLAEGLQKKFDGCSEIKRRDSIGQDDIDSILAEAGLQESG